MLTTEVSRLYNIPPNIKKTLFIPSDISPYIPPPSITPTSSTLFKDHPSIFPLLSHHHPLTPKKMVMMKHPFLTIQLLLILFSFYSTTSLAQSPTSSPTSAPSAPAPAPSTPPIDIIRILKKAGGFTTLIRLLQTTQVNTQINSQLLNSNGGLTLFAPNDNAFASLKSGFLNSLSDQQKNELIQFHLLPTFVSTTNFDTLSNPVRTQAGENPDRLALNVTSTGGNQVNLTTGIVNTTVGGTVYSDHQLAVYQVDKVLLPRDFFVAKPPAPAPAPAKHKASKKKSAEGPADSADDDVSSAVSVMMMMQQRNIGMWVVPIAVAVAAFSL